MLLALSILVALVAALFAVVSRDVRATGRAAVAASLEASALLGGLAW